MPFLYVICDKKSQNLLLLLVYNQIMKWFRRNKKNIVIENRTPQQTEKIEFLRAEINHLEKRIEEYVAREREVEEVLNFAKMRAEEYEKEAKIRFALERERLSSYREKWQKRLDSLGNADRLGEEILECNEYFKNISDELRGIINDEKIINDQPTETYVKETKRLKELGVSNAPEVMLSEEDLNKLLLQFNN